MSSTARDDTADYREIFLRDTPLIDTRAPVEFQKGSFPHAVNLPLMTDQERQRVGTCYKQKGQQAAIDLGHQLVSGQVKQERVEAWLEFAHTHPDGLLFCFRGGLRSQICQQWLAEAGAPYPRITGGYKAMRTFLIGELESAVRDCEFLLVGGLTGVGKTEVLVQLENAIDLEHHANHRGSSFGKHASPQPTQINFENALSIDLLKRRSAGQQRFVLEDEGRMIGSCHLPLPLYQEMSRYPLVWLEDSFDNRVERILRDYIVDLCGEFVALYGSDKGTKLFAQRLRQSLAGIIKRLGHKRHAELDAIMVQALEQQLANGAIERHRDWITQLLGEYYDPMYAYQRTQKADRIIFSGNQREVVEYLTAHQTTIP